MKIRRFVSLVLVAVCLLAVSGCYSHRVNVAGYDARGYETKVYSKTKQFYLFEGLIPLGRPQPGTPPDGVCQIRTYYNFWDALFTCVTGGLFSMRTVKVITVVPGTNYAEIFGVGDKVSYVKGKMPVEGTIVGKKDAEHCIVATPDGKRETIRYKQITGAGE